MEKIDGFIRENAEELRVLFPATDELVKAAESAMGVELGPQLRKYVMRYGLILYDGYEVYSMNSRAGISSNMIVETIKMHKTDQNTRDLIVIDYDEEVGGIFVDSNDNVYNFSPVKKEEDATLNLAIMFLRHLKNADWKGSVTGHMRFFGNILRKSHCFH